MTNDEFFKFRHKYNNPTSSGERAESGLQYCILGGLNFWFSSRCQDTETIRLRFPCDSGDVEGLSLANPELSDSERRWLVIAMINLMDARSPEKDNMEKAWRMLRAAIVTE